jgi:NTP pyrophosphatase (non-canonical NTP hydrolase)
MNMPPYTEAIEHLEIVRDNLTHGHRDHEDNYDDVTARIRNIEDAISLLKTGMLGGTSALISLVRQWGIDKGITGPNGKATLQSQFKKLLEEVYEIEEGIVDKDQHELIDGIGDSTVVLILLAELAGVKFETCLLAAYEEIKGRTGRMSEEGIFIKDV